MISPQQDPVANPQTQETAGTQESVIPMDVEYYTSVAAAMRLLEKQNGIVKLMDPGYQKSYPHVFVSIPESSPTGEQQIVCSLFRW